MRNCVQIFCKKQEFEAEAWAQTSGFLAEFRNGKLLEDSQDSWSEPIEAPWPSNNVLLSRQLSCQVLRSWRSRGLVNLLYLWHCFTFLFFRIVFMSQQNCRFFSKDQGWRIPFHRLQVA